MRKIWGGVVLVACALAVGCGKQGAPSAESLEARIDRHGDEIMASSTKGEARAWMKEPKHVFFKADPKEVAKFVEDFYNAGAVQVLIGDVEEEQGNQFAGSILVVLPTDAPARAKLFAIDARADTAFDCDPVSDKGQKYLYYPFD